MNYTEPEIETLKRLKEERSKLETKKIEDRLMDREMSIALIRGAGLLPPEEDNLDWASTNFCQLNQLVLLVQMVEAATIMSLMQGVNDLAELELAAEEVAQAQRKGVKLS